MHNLPSPVPSPSLKATDSRKRQRSSSMESIDTSTSPKRQPTPMALDPVDVCMESQGETQISLDDARKDPKERWDWAERLKDRNMVVGETWYVISREWWKRWRRACTGEIDKDGPVNESDIAAVNNSGLVDAYGNLQMNLSEGVDVEYLPSEVWNALVAWYGPAYNPLPRKVIERGEAKQMQLELHPPQIKVLKLVKLEPSTLTKLKRPPAVSVSAHDTVKSFLEAARLLFPQETGEYRVWKVDTALFDVDGPECPISVLKLSEGKVIEASEKTLEEAMLDGEDLVVIEFKSVDGAWLVDLAAMDGAPLPAVFNSSDGFFNRFARPTAVTPATEANSEPRSIFKKPPTARKSVSIRRGTLGLGNLGNTCFMNSALQCLAHQQELSEYFLSGVYEKELNPDNPLGMHGAIAQAFGALLQRIWDPNPPSTSYSPRDFKMQLQRFAPQFSGYQQHDSQELVAFLLDGLHEDLNRVLKKPYVEKPDWEGGGDVELIQFAQKSWEGYMLRNDSVIVDLFQGQYQSTLVCPECKKVSITFDPFMYLTLPIPVEKKWRHTVFYIPWDTTKPHVKVPVELGRDSSFKDMRQLLGRWMGTNPDNLLTMEIFSNRFYKNLNDNVLCGEMSDNDIIVCFELPCHAQQSRTYKPQAGDPFILPLYLCEPPQRNTFTVRGVPCFGYPAVIAITQEQAKSMDSIREVIVERLERWTKNGAHLYSWEHGTVNGNDAKPIQIDSSSVVPPVDRIAEIVSGENGDVTVKVEEVPPSVEEGDITDEKDVILGKIGDIGTLPAPSTIPVKTGPKPGTYTLKLQANHKDFGTTNAMYGPSQFEDWAARQEDSEDGVLLRPHDSLYCEFDENMKAFFFGDERSRWENARWDDWETFVHPEYEAAKKSDAAKKHKGLTLQDCLDEFTKEEQLGEDDLWYCPKCKKHQQATKKFDLWSAPDILVVHLKRFSNSRMLRDKIDTFVDFPVEGLDLGEMIGERKVAKRLMEQGIDASEFNLGNLEEPLIYDLFGVDEHMGGLGGGHYRAYALNHEAQKWYDFNDAFVTESRAQTAVNANAYLLFYRRRSSDPLGGKTYTKIQEWREKLSDQIEHEGPTPEEPTTMAMDTSLPTPPSEPENYGPRVRRNRLRPSLPAEDESEGEVDLDAVAGAMGGDLLQMPSSLSQFRLDVEPSEGTSPSSSVEAEPDLDADFDPLDATLDDQYITTSLASSDVSEEDWGDNNYEPRLVSSKRRRPSPEAIDPSLLNQK